MLQWLRDLLVMPQAGLAINLWAPVQNEDVGPLFIKSFQTAQQRVNQGQGPSEHEAPCDCVGHMSIALALTPGAGSILSTAVSRLGAVARGIVP